jgi:hypothetical protein
MPNHGSPAEARHLTKVFKRHRGKLSEANDLSRRPQENRSGSTQTLGEGEESE